jgi:two-component system, NtrC family, nitrogen regulation sensor histidine kinase NtrY
MRIKFYELINFAKSKTLRIALEFLVVFGFLSCLGFLFWSFETRDWLMAIFVPSSWLRVLFWLSFFIVFGYALYRILASFVRYYGGNYALTFRKKVSFVLGSIAIAPILILSIFMLFLYASMQAWFDDRVTNTVEKAVSISEIYLEEHKNRLSNTAMQLVRDIESHYGALLDGGVATDFLDKAVDSGLFNEALIFKSNPAFVLARTTLSFFSLNELPHGILQRVPIGKSVEIYSDTYGVQVLSRFLQNEDTYLIVTKSIDKQIVEYLDQTNGAVASYEKLQNNISILKSRFVMALCFVSVCLLGASVYTIVVFTGKITRPLQVLVDATTKVQEGDFNVKVPVALDKDEISILSSAFNEMVCKLKNQRRDLLIAQKSLAWAEVARRVAHEINNPLTPIKLSTEILQSRFGLKVENPKDFKKYTTNILEYVDDIKNIVSSFVYFARLPQPNFQTCSLGKWLAGIVDVRRNTMPNISYVFSNLVFQESNVMCDLNQMSQVLNNLLTNAEEALLAYIKKPIIEVYLEEDPNHYKITVSDNGPGFSLGILSSVTEPYVSTKSRSSGLGLAIVDKIVKDHNGWVEFSNKKEGGAKGMVVLPKIQFES